LKHECKFNNKRNILFDVVTTFVIRIIREIRRLVLTLKLTQTILKLCGVYFFEEI
jgi:hypothetical protein